MLALSDVTCLGELRKSIQSNLLRVNELFDLHTGDHQILTCLVVIEDDLRDLLDECVNMEGSSPSIRVLENLYCRALTVFEEISSFKFD